MKERIARMSDRMFDRMRDKRAFTITEDTATDGDFSSLRGHHYAVLVTFRRDGQAVPSPVWFGLDDRGGVVYVHTAPHAGKVKRLRRDSRARDAIRRNRCRGERDTQHLVGERR